MDRSSVTLVVVITLLFLGAALMAIPPDPSKRRLVEREAVSLMEGVGATTNLDGGRGLYEVWIEDSIPGVPDYGHLFFEVSAGDASVEVVRGDGNITRLIDGVPHELFCTFEVTGRGLVSYSFGTVEPGHDGERFELVFMRTETRLDIPTFWAGIIVVIIWLGLGVSLLLLRREEEDQSLP